MQEEDEASFLRSVILRLQTQSDVVLDHYLPPQPRICLCFVINDK